MKDAPHKGRRLAQRLCLAATTALLATTSAISVSSAASVVAAPPSVAEFYKGKMIRFLISTPPGSGYDTYARLLMRHYGDYIPGNPKFIPQNMPAAGGVVLLNTAANIGPFDGTLMFTLHFNLPLYQATGGEGIRFDIGKMRSIGRLLASNAAIGVSTKSATGVKTFEDVLQKEIIIGSTGASSNSFLFPTILNKMAGAKFKVVPGYDGDSGVFLAMERGEVDGFGSYSYLTFQSMRPDMLTKKMFYPLVQWGIRREEAWPDVPTAIDIAKTPRDKKAMEIVSAGSDIGFSYFLPPGVPEERVKALQDAFDATIKDPTFLADAQGANLALRTASGKEMETIVGNVLTAPKDAIDRAVELMKVGN
jgi:tripartite-type tricarboxylate transporter receptor subunit TctC